MLTKFETKSNRVKGLSFHPVRPWILASLHNGQIQLWDYRMGTCLDKFEEHDGPVRGVDFHRSQSLIVSGGDDYKVKVWDYKLRRCLFTLLGHLDYIRTVQFHVEYPWIVSASDDQTIRIWNWQSRNCISVLTGHNHYVMCAAFHPKEDMIVSASLDQTVRVWDTTGLRKKTVRGAPPQIDDANVVSRVNNELFGGNDAVVKYVLEGHERGVNWAAFHPTLPLIISGADDRQVKLWRMNETKAWEVDTMRGHTNNVSCVLFHPKHELIVSNSEDRTIRVWDISKRMGVQTFRRENDRFWILAAHPDQNLLAAGHDSGMIVFKLERERPAFDSLANRCFYIKDRYLRVHEYSSGKDLPLVSLRRASTNNTPGIGGGPRVLVYNTLNKTENNVLIQSDAEGGSYELITFSTEATSSGDAQDVRRGNGLAATFIARDRFVVLDKSKQLLVKNFQNEVIKRYTPAIAGLDNLFYCGTSGRAILKSDDRVVLYDFQARKNIAELQVPRVKYVIWNQDYSMVALISKHQIVLANKQFDHLFTISETVRVKSGCWDTAKNIFIYATSNHVKYALPFGDKGIIRTLDIPMYLVRSSGNTIHCIDREGKVRVLEIDITEALFKIALNNNDYGDVMRIVKHSRLCGQSIVSYLQQKGYPEVALHFVNDNKTRFKLALACGNIQVAMNVAHDLDDDAWLQLGIEALRQGNFEVVEMSYQKTKDFERLSFLYLITGNLEKLKKMMKIAEMRSDVMSVLHNSLFLGEVEERVKILEAAGQIPLAYLIAQIYRLEEPATRLANLLPENLDFSNYLKNNPQLLLPPTPIFRCENWPYLALSTSYDPKSIHSNSKYDVEDVKEVAGNWGDDDDIFEDALDTEPAKSKVSKVGSVDAVEGGWKDDDLDLSDDEETRKPVVSEKLSETSFNFPQLGNPLSLTWCADSSHAADHFAAGAVENAIQLLHRQIAASQMSVLKPIASTVFLGSHGYLPGAFHTSSVRQYLSRESAKAQFPSLPFSVSYLLESLKQAYRLFTAAQMEECKSTLESIIRTIPLVSVASKTESDDLKELVGICREYLISLKVKALLDQSTDVSRTLELAAYFTHCNLQSKHLVLALKTAMATAFKNKNFANAAAFAHRLLDLPEMSSESNAELKGKALKVLQKSEMQGRNEYKIDYDERNPFTIDCEKISPIYKGNAQLTCPYCGACYNTSYQGKVCTICSLCTVGVTSVGLVTQSTNRSRK